MTETEPMGVKERGKYLHKMRIRYWQAESKSAKSALLDEMQSSITTLHRKSVLRLITGDLAGKPRRKQRGKTYEAEIQSVGEKIAYSLDYPCAERLQPNLVWMAKHLDVHGEIELNADLQTKLETISVSTVRRLLPTSQRAAGRIAHSKKTSRGSYAQRQAISMRRIPWQESTPGHFEVDLVHHCGLSASGQYVYTLQMTDVATGWSECMAILGRSYRVMQDGFQRIEKRLPFPIVEVHPDNGSEFLNDPLVRFWQERAHPLELSRSRPYFKSDNCLVEENNFSQGRAHAGYNRLDIVAQTHLLNRL